MHYNGANSYVFVNGRKIVKAKDSKIVASPLCLGNISKDMSIDNMKKTGLNGYGYKFNVDYSDFSVVNPDKTIPLIHNYFISKYDIV